MSQRGERWSECRACRCESTTANLIDVFSSGFDFPSIIYKLTNIQINKDDSISTMLCTDCVTQLIQIAKFRLLLIESNEFLHHRHSNADQIADKRAEVECVDYEALHIDCVQDEAEGDANMIGNVVLLEIEGALDDVRPTVSSESDSPNTFSGTDQADVVCKMCGKVFASIKSLRIHQYVHNLGKFVCNLCSRVLTTAGFLRLHMHNVHNVFVPKSTTTTTTTTISMGQSIASGTSNCQCDICKLYFPHERIGQHMRTHIKKLHRPRCLRCPQTFSCRKNLQRHFKKQHGNGVADDSHDHEFHCGVCPATFRRAIESYEHSKEHDIDCVETADGHNLTCDHCSIAHTDYEAYARHMIDVHHVERVQPYKCRICAMRNGSRTGLFKHVTCHYNATASLAAGHTVNDDRPFACTYCSLRLKSVRRLDEHIRVHTGEQPFGCEACDKRFKTRTTLGKHMKSRHSTVRDHLCAACGKNFATKTVLAEHMLLHTGERPFRCEHCDKSFTGMSRLREHTRIHTGERPYICDVCSKPFRSHTNRRHHMISMHSDERKHLCTICGKKFKFNSGLKTHMWTHSRDDKPYNCDRCKRGFGRLKKLNMHLCAGWPS